ncbi:recombinational DNA repair protein (RecF pathway) [Levilactobacillus namurensis DSM 19117]|uniref:DNA repair protein RecO n=1 Tax=Levilactobacillus namurensis DSM 19117 TaxID=1423773 RepID=A0A0R1K1R3_9LACO|nr:DNA repair protein RecO [Levilactobacillus namurensis]KRK77000.1 recombinational DNA repair protein (RecF pathway) [Levilactobacillus namurensis DSM 19117]
MALARHVTDFHGILLFRRDYAERDYLVKFFTQEFGKKMFLVRGAKKKGFKMTADILPFTVGSYVGDIADDGLSYIRTARETRQFQAIGTDIFKNAYATYVMSLVDIAFPDSQQLPDWYHKVHRALDLIDEGLNPAIVTNIIEIQLMPAFGVAPQLLGCAVCGRNDLPFDYSESYGGLLCQRHWAQDPRRLHLNQRTIYYLRQFSVLDLDRLHTIKVKPATEAALRQLMDEIYASQIGVHPRSKRFLDQMQSWAPRLAQNPTTDN